LQVQGISIREFARRDGCSDTAVREQGIRTGALKAFEDGSLDPALVGTGWRPANRNPAKRPKGLQVKVKLGETPAAAAERIVADGATLLDIADAEKLKENYLARLKQLEYDIKSGAVVPAADVERIVGEEYAAVRTRLLAIPAEHAPRIHRCKTVAEVQDVLMSVVVQALEHLVRDRARAVA
jgi:hypothetical protein